MAAQVATSDRNRRAMGHRDMHLDSDLLRKYREIQAEAGARREMRAGAGGVN